MAAEVNSATTSTTVVTVKPRASVQVVSPDASVSYALPVTAVQYILLQTSAELDVRGRYPFFSDSYVVVDDITLAVAKQLYDAISVQADLASFVVSKPFTDAVSPADEFARQVAYIRAFAESVGVSDFQYFDIIKNLSDVIALDDEHRVDFGKFFLGGVAMNDTAIFTDDLVTAVSKGIMNMTFMSDEIRFDSAKVLNDVPVLTDAYAMVFGRPLDDTFELADAVELAAGKLLTDSQSLDDGVYFFAVDKVLADSFGFSETMAFDTAKVLADSFGFSDVITFSSIKELTDAFTTSDVHTVAFTKSQAPDIIEVSDFSALSPGKGLFDDLGTDDSGSLISQGYCDITYFAADYVGETRTFT